MSIPDAEVLADNCPRCGGGPCYVWQDMRDLLGRECCQCSSCDHEWSAPAQDSASPGAVMVYPKLCDCGRGSGTPHQSGCAALTDSAGQVKP